MEKYAKDLVIEGLTLKTMVYQNILPSAFAYRKELSEALISMKTLGMDVSKAPEKALLDELSDVTSKLLNATDKLVAVVDKVNSLEGDEQAVVANSELTVSLDQVRALVDTVEVKTSDRLWAFPKYTELLF
jgi:glutamine synthetase